MKNHIFINRVLAGLLAASMMLQMSPAFSIAAFAEDTSDSGTSQEQPAEKKESSEKKSTASEEKKTETKKETTPPATEAPKPVKKEEPKPTEPAPTKATEPKPTEPAPTKATEPKPTEPAPTKATEPKPTEPAPTKATEPKPTEPAPTKATEPKPTEPAPTKATEPEPTKATEPEPTKATEPAPTKATEPTHETTEPKQEQKDEPVSEEQTTEPSEEVPDETEASAEETQPEEQEVESVTKKKKAAAQEELEEPEPQNEEYDFQIRINNHSAANGANLKIAYGEYMKFTLAGCSETAEYFYATEENARNDVWTPIGSGVCHLEIGKYYLNYGVNIDDEYYEDKNLSFSVEITKGKLPVPDNRSWNGSSVSWDAVDNSAVSDYTLRFYRDETCVQTEKTNGTSYQNFANQILTNNYGAGVYTFTVQTNVSDAGKNHYFSSDESGHCEKFTVPTVVIEKGNGIAEFSPDKAVLIPGVSGNNSFTAEAAMKPGYGNLKWSASGVSIADDDETKTDITIEDGYNGAATIKVTVSAEDITAPVISEFTATKDGKLTGTAVDNEDGIAFFAFSKESDAKSVTDWTAGTDFTGAPTESGSYYFHVKDAAGNTETSTNTISVTKVTFWSNYGDNKPEVCYQAGNNSVALTDPAARPGWDFTGWYTDSGCTGSPVDSVPHSENGVELYAGWKKQPFPETLSIGGVEKEYNGASEKLDATVKNNTGNIQYKWYRTDSSGAETMVADTAAISVKNVADSGTYRVVASIVYDDGDTASAESNQITVAISAKDLYVKAKPAEVFFGEDFDNYQVDYEGFAPGEGAGNITVGALACQYKAGDPVGSYDITIEEGSFAADNYIIHTENAKLTVKNRVVTLTAVLKNPDETYTYARDASGNSIAYHPEVIVMEGDKEFTGTYTIDYEHADEAGDAYVVVTPSGNYSGDSYRVKFHIGKATFETEVAIGNWKYGFDPVDPDVKSNVSGGNVVFTYAEKDSDNFVSNVPTNAGKYVVRAEIEETGNYDSVSAVCEFEILKRDVTVTAGSGEFPYTGMPHSVSSYVIGGDKFVDGEGFSRITVTGSRIDVTDENGVPNVITSHVLSNKTNPDNYNLEYFDGAIVVTPVKLPVPTNMRWDSAVPGTATWVHVSKKNLTPVYNVTLYAFDGSTYREVARRENVSDNTVDFAAAIREDALACESTCTYAFKVETLPAPAAEGEAQNYTKGDESAYCGALKTAIIRPVATENVPTVLISGAGTGEANYALLLEGETAVIQAKLAEGYRLNDPSYEVNPTGSLRVVTSEPDDDSFDFKAEVSVASGASGSQVSDFIVRALDDNPYVYHFDAKNDTPNVVLEFGLRDAQGLKGWAVTKSAESPAPDSGVWQLFAEPCNEFYKNDYVIRYSDIDQNAGVNTYYIHVMDVSGNTETYYAPNSLGSGEPNGINIYTVELQPGGAAGDSVFILKAQNKPLHLPDNPYSWPGYAFQNWHGRTGIYTNGGVYGENKSDVLKANWTNNHHDYQVNYYYMDLNGEYGDPEVTKTFNAIYGTEVRAAADALQISKTGFSLDPQYSSNFIMVDGDDLTLDVYYQRNKYNVVLYYTDIDNVTPVEDTIECYYGADLSTSGRDGGNVFTKPVREGYQFVGWLFGDSGDAPETMPAYDVKATGSFQAKPAAYHIRYYLQNIDAEDNTKAGETYTLADSMSQDFNAFQDDPVSMNASLALNVDGYMFYKTAFSYGDLYGSTCPADAADSITEKAVAPEEAEDSEESPAENKDLFVYVYLNRKTYNIRLNVWKDTVGVGTPIYTDNHWNVVFGAKFPDGVNEYEKDKWMEQEDPAYLLAAYTGWSTGEKPDTMPAGDVTVTRQYVKRTTGTYRVEVWTETADPGHFTLTSFNYYDNVGMEVSIGADAQSALKNSIEYLEYYKYLQVKDTDIGKTVFGAGLTGGTVESGIVTNTNAAEDGTVPEEELVLRIFFERETVDTTIRYYYDDPTTGERSLMGTLVKSGKWGTQYHTEALALFDSGLNLREDGEYTPNSSFSVVDPVSYNFRSNLFVVSYSGRYRLLRSTPNWPNVKYNTEASVGEEAYSGNKSYFGYVDKDNTNYINVYYTKPDPYVFYEVNVVYTDTNLTHSQKIKKAPVLFNGMPVRLANEAKFFTDVTYLPEDSSVYPGLSLYNRNQTNAAKTNGKFVYSIPDTSYETISYNGKTYYTDGNYVYIPVATNPFYFGNTASYSFAVDERYPTDPGYEETIKAFMTSYREQYSDDPYAQGIRVYNHSIGPVVVNKGTQNPTQTLEITFLNGEVYSLKYSLDGVVCNKHEFASGTEINEKNFGCGAEHDTFKPIDGYEIVWYTDPGCTEVQTLPFTMTGNRILYGKYEKAILANVGYVYYELANELEGVKYITESNLSDYEDMLTVGEDGNTWFLDGQMVLRKVDLSCESFSEVVFDVSGYGQSGLYYDDANPENHLKDFCQTEPVTLRAYFARTKVNFTVDLNYEDTNPEVTECRAGQTMALADPKRDGYTFAGWDWFIGSDDQAWSDAPIWTKDSETASISFAMPNSDVKAVAKWDTASYEATIVHYFQNPESLSYDTSAAKGEAAGSIVINYNGAAINGSICSNGSVSFENSGRTWYFTGAQPILDDEGNVTGYSVFPENLSAIVEVCDVEQEDELNVSEKILSVDHYGFAYARYQYKGEIETLDASDTFKAMYGMQMDLYYTLESGIQIDTEALDVNGNPCAMTLIGEGRHHYGEKITISASLPAGYVFIGWYKGSVADSNLIDTQLSFNQTVTGSAKYIAVAKAIPVGEASVVADGIKQLNYGYAASTKNAVTAVVTMPTGDDASTHYVSAYEWTLKKPDGTESVVANSATYQIPEGWEQGSYELKCKATVKRRDNGLEMDYYTDVHTVVVDPAAMTVAVKNYSGRYDTKLHHATLTVDPLLDGKDFEIYYAEEKLTADNYKTVGKTDIASVSYKDVAVDGDGKVISRKVYYYIHTESDNYNDYAAVEPATVLITPVPVTLKAGSGVFHKEYDGKYEVQGSISDPNTDLYKLARGTNIYQVVGILPGDSASGKYIISCDAVFRNRHVMDDGQSNMVTLSNIVLADNDNNIVYNYDFADTYSIDLSGYIDPKELELDWTETSLVYNADKQVPVPTIKTVLPDEDKGALIVSVSGEQVNVGTGYNAIATLKSLNDPETQVTDFSLKLNQVSVDYEIVRRPITVSPQENSFIYDGNPHDLNGKEFVVTKGSLAAEDHSVSGVSAQTYTNAGTHSVESADVHVFAGDTDVTENYVVTNGSASMVISPLKIAVSGIGANNKPYDGTTDATGIWTEVTFRSLEEGIAIPETDHPALDPNQVVLKFTDSAVGNDKKVTIEYMDKPLGDENVNFELVKEESQLETKANITANEITVKVKDATTVYGESVAYEISYAGMQNGEEAADIISGDVIVNIIKGDTTEPYTPGDDAGEYEIVLNLDNLDADNYTFVAETGKKLTVVPRPVAVQSAENVDIQKTYDGKVSAAVEREHYVFTAVADIPASGLLDKDDLSLSKFTAAYNDPNVKLADTVTVTELEIEDGNYKLVTESFDIVGHILPKEIDIAAKSQSIVYGAEQKPKYELANIDFVNGETVAVLAGTLDFDCAFDPADPNYRNVGTYSITPKGLSSDNYKITFVSTGELKVTKKPILVTANGPATVRYGTEDALEFDFTHAKLAYEDNWNEVVSGEVGYIHEVETSDITVDGAKMTVISSVPGNPSKKYPVKADVSKLESDNYSFTGAGYDLKILGYSLTVDGIELNSKVYDGTRTVLAKQIDLSGVPFDNLLLPIDRAYFEANAGAAKITVSGQYESKNAAQNIPVSLTVGLAEYLAQRCTLNADTQDSAYADITKRPLQITANDKTVLYGKEAPAFTVTYGKVPGDDDSGFVTGESAGKDDVSYTCEYAAPDAGGKYSDVTADGYTIHPYGFKGSTSAELQNYDPTGHYVDGVLTVQKNKFPECKPVWNSKSLGTVTWDALADIGNVPVKEYRVQLCESGSPIGEAVTVAAGETLAVDFAQKIHDNGISGAYTVKVNAVTSDSQNVEDGAAGTTPSVLYASKVEFRFHDDTVSQNGGSSSNINGAASYVMIAGEPNVDISAVLVNTTGYTVNSVTTTNSALSVNEYALEKDNFTGKVSMAASLSVKEDIYVDLKLDERTPLLKAVVTPKAGEGQAKVDYGYSNETAPKLTVNVEPLEGEVEPYNGYTYFYTWELKTGNNVQTWPEVSSSESTMDWYFPTGKNANKSETYYAVRCMVTAQRNDNNAVAFKTVNTWKASDVNEHVTNVSVLPASFKAKVLIDGWTYGETRKEPSLEVNVDQTQIGEVTYSFATAASYNTPNPEWKPWSEIKNAVCGEYYVWVQIAESTNYQALNAYSEKFEISRAKLDTPEKLGIAHTDDSYAVIHWDEVKGPIENNNVSPASHIDVSYKVELFRGTGADRTLIETYNTEDTEVDIANKVYGGGTFSFDVTAISSNDKNCEDSDTATYGPIVVGAVITSPNASKEYDGDSVDLTAKFENGPKVTGYKWYFGTDAISGSGDTIHVYNVSDSGEYTCVLTLADGTTVITPAFGVSITRRELKLTSDNHTRTYNGSNQKGETADVVADRLAKNEKFIYTMTGGRTDVGGSGEKQNTFTYKPDAATGAILGNYHITCEYGDILMKPKSIADSTVLVDALNADGYVYTGSPQNLTPGVKDSERGGTALVVGETKDFVYSYEANTNVGEATITITGKNNYTDSRTVKFQIKQKPLRIFADHWESVYTGKPISSAEWDNTGLINGHTINITYSVTGTFVRDEAYPGQFHVPASKMITDADNNDVTQNYQIVMNEGSLKIIPIATPIVITANSKTRVYNGQDLTDKGFSYEPKNLGFGDELVVVVEGTVKDFGSVDNVVKSYRVVHKEAGKDDVDVTNAYTFGTSQKGTLEVTKRPVYVESISISKIYNGEDLKGVSENVSVTTATADTGLVSGESFVFTMVGTRKDVGTTPNGNTFTWAAGNQATKLTNYEIHPTYGDLVVNAKSVAGRVHIAVEDLPDMIYKGSAYTPKPVVTDDECGVLREGEDKDFTYSYLNNVDAGTATVIVTGHNNFTGEERIDFQILPRPVYLKSENISKIYDGTALKGETKDVSVEAPGVNTGLVSGEELSFTMGGSRTNAGTTEHGNTFDCLAGNAATKLTNYDLETHKTVGDITILPRPITSEFTVGTIVNPLYDGKQQKPTPAVTSDLKAAMEAGEDKDFVYSYGENKDAGTATVTITGRNNYTGFITKEFTILPRTVKLTSSGDRKTYDGKPLTNDTVTIGGDRFAVGEGVTCNVTGSQLYSGSSDNEFTYQLNPNTKAGNYQISTSFGTLIVDPIGTKIVITAASDEKEYDGTPLENDKYSFAPNVLAEGDVLKAVVEGTITDFGTVENVVTSYAVMRGTEDVTENYSFGESIKGELRITRAPVRIIAQPNEKIYGSKDPTLTVKIEGMKHGESADALLTYEFSREAGENAGKYPITVTCEAIQGNYEVQGVAADFLIKPKVVTLKWDYDSFVYNGTRRSVTAEITNKVTWDGKSDDVRIGSYGGDIGKKDAAGYMTKAVKLTGADAANYTLVGANVDHKWKITPRSLADKSRKNGYAVGITVADLEDLIYDGSDQEPTVSVKDDLTKAGGSGISKLVEGKDYKLTYEENRNAGTATVTITGIGNYKDSIKKTFVIKPLPVNIIWENNTYTYDGTEKTITGRIGNAVPGDSVNIGGYTGNSGMDAGSYTANVVSLTGADADNYTLEGGNNLAIQWQIEPAKITLTADDKESEQGETLCELTWQITDGEIFGEDELGEILLTTTAEDAAGSYPIEISLKPGTENQNYDIALVNGVYKITSSDVVIPTTQTEPSTEPSTEPDPTIPPEKTVEPGEPCLWHWLIVVVDIIYALILVLTMGKKKYDLPAAEERKQDMHRSRNVRLVSDGVLVLIMALLNVLGRCWLELPMSIISVFGISLLMWVTFRNKFPKEEISEAETV